MMKQLKGSSVEEDLRDLKLRFELLEGDRKAYYETSQWAIRQNKEEVVRLRKQNKEVAEAVMKLKKLEADTNSGRLTMTDVEKLDHLICEMNKKYDELLADMKAREQKLTIARDQLTNMKREASLIKTQFQDSPQAREIRNLENRLDKAMIKYNEAQSVRKTYEQIIKRLEEERLTFDNRLSAFERSLKVKKQDAHDLEMMSRDANHAKEVARAELTRFEQQISEERKQREKELMARKELVKQKMELNDRFDRKALQFDDLKDNMGLQNDSKKDAITDEKEKKIAEYEETMRLIKEATGVSDINEVIAKFQAQGETHNHLRQLQEDNEAKIEKLKKKRAEVLAEYEELKFSGEAKLSSSKQIVHDFEKHSQEATAKMADAKAKCEKLSKLVANTIAGVQHLHDKLVGIHLNEGKATPTSGQTAEQNPAQMLDVCVQKLDTLMSSLIGKELPEAATPAAPGQPGEVVSILQVNSSLLPAFNTRIKMKPVEFEAADPDEDDEDEDDGEVPDRETMKRQTTQLLNAQNKNKQQKLKKKKKSDKDEEDDD